MRMRDQQLDHADDRDQSADNATPLINRDVSDLAFVRRVLEAAENESNPVLERARYLAITGMLLDEFYKIRVAALREQIRSGATTRSQDGMKPSKQLKRADKYSNRLIVRQDLCWRGLKQDLETAGIELVTLEQLDSAQSDWLATVFARQIRPHLAPTSVEIVLALAAIKDGGLFLFAELDMSGGNRSTVIVPIPAELPRFIEIPGKGQRFIPVEEIIKACIGEIFPNGVVLASGLARILREGSLKRFGDGDDLLRQVRDAIERREHADVIRLRVERDMPEHLTRALAATLGLLRPEDIKPLEKSRLRATASEFVVADSFLGLPDLTQLVDQLPDEFADKLRYPAVKPRQPDFVAEFEGDMFRAIAARDRMLHFPYDDFDVLVKLLQQAAADPSVVSIKQTLYRTGKDSPVVEALAKAAQRGAAVAVVVELEAREDEISNIALAEFLEAAGVKVSYGFPKLKVHVKLLIIERSEAGSIKRYLHCSTGNYEVAAGNHYTDLCLLSADETLANEAEQLFSYVHHGRLPSRLTRIAVAPLGLRKALARLIRAEIRNAEAGRPAAIWMKLNKLSDKRMIRLLYQASQSGVDIRIIVRGICCLRPGVAGVSDRIQVKSIVGRYLEHSRSLCFGNGHRLPSDSASVFISSADLMAHKLDRRVEALVSIEDAELRARIQQEVFVAYFKDQANSWILQANDRWARQSPTGFCVQKALSAATRKTESAAGPTPGIAEKGRA